MKTLDIINALAATTKRTAKEAILKKQVGNETLREVFRLTYTPQIRFNIKQIPSFTTSMVSKTLAEALVEIEDAFVVKKIRGHDAQDILSTVLSELDPDDATVLEMVIKRDLRCGATSSTANKIWKDLIPDQPCMLASSFKQNLVDDILQKAAFAELKADGARCMTIVDDVNEVTMVSRNGKQYQNLTDLKKVIQSMNIQNFVLDGELVYAPDGLDNVVDRAASNGIVNKSNKGTISDEEQSGIVYQVWDIIPLDVYTGKDMSLNMPYRLRKNVLTDVVTNTGAMDKISLIPFTIVYTAEEASAVYRGYTEQGLEGIILKDPESLWEDRRSKSLVKYKEEHTADLEIVEVIEGTGKNKGSLGALRVKTACELLECKVGTGFKANQRQELWEIRDQLPGQITQLKYNGILKSKSKETYSLFLPVYQEIRWDKSIANRLDELSGYSE